MKKIAALVLFVAFVSALRGQTNILCTNPLAEQVMLGNYDPAQYAADVVITDPAIISSGIASGVSPDSLKSYIIRLSQFGTRNTGSDTLSNTSGYGAARRWTVQQFQQFSAEHEDRLIVSYLQFDQDICGIGRHANVLAILPGTDTVNPGIILIEGHMDSRCAVLCDVNCTAEGVEDNASGTALVLELARVMSPYTFANTLVFCITTGEEQGLLGAEAMAQYIQNKGITLRAVLNNDVIGGVICGQTSSPPSCPGLNDVDSTSVRLFSALSFNSPHKQLARYIKLQYKENILPTAAVPMNVRIMAPEDRTGRGGDHIPFREKGFTAMRFTAANEHGDASNGPGYTDRQHTSSDVLGVDTDGDGSVDSFFVQFNYLARNAVINGNAAAMIARAIPRPADFTAFRTGTQLTVSITDPAALGQYRVALRTATNDWDTVFTLAGNTGVFPCNPTGAVIVSVAGVDAQGIESLFGNEKLATNVSATGTPLDESSAPIRLFQNRPNPFDEATWISFWVNEVPKYQKAWVQISDLQGKEIARLPVVLQQGMNETLYTHGYGVYGYFTYSLIIDGQIVDSRQMVFAN